MRLCSFEGCDRPLDCKNLCGGHYKQLCEGKELKPLIVKRHGDWTLDKLLGTAKKVGDCFLRDRPYSKVRHNGEHQLTHRLSYILFTGEDIDGLSIHHKCANNRCINPEHLERASRAENTLEMIARKDYEAEIARLQLRVIELEAELERANV